MLKKTLLAVGILASAAVHSADFMTAQHLAVEHTDEGIVGLSAGTGVATVGALVRLNASYQVNDTITVTLNQAKAANSSFPANLYSNKLVGAVNANSVEINGGAQVVGATSIVITGDGGTEAAKIVVGKSIIIAGDATPYYVKSVTTTALGIFPPLARVPADDADLTVYNNHTFTLDLLSSSSTSATYRVASAPTGGVSTIGALLALPAVNVTPAGLIAADATIAYTAATAGGVAMDALAAPIVIAKSSPAYAQVITKFDGIIDVEQGRLAFKGGTSSAGGDTLTFANTTDAGTAGDSAATTTGNVLTVLNNIAQTATTEGGVVHTIDGDFTWLDTAAATAGIQTTGVSGSITPALNAAGTAITITDASAVESSTTLTIAKTAASKAFVIPVSSFSGKSVYTYTSGTVQTKTVTHSNLGGFTLNGAAVTAYGVPMGSTVSRFLWVNNKGAIPAAMSAIVTTSGTSYGPYSVGSAAAKTSMSMSAALDAALTAAGVTLADNSRANIEFSSPVKAGDVTISAAYKHIADADRLTLETSDTVVGSISCTGTGSARTIVTDDGAGAMQNDDSISAGTTTDSCTNAK